MENLSSYEGRQKDIPSLQIAKLETFENVFPGKDYTIDFTIPEFTAVCPKTGLPDFGIIEIQYSPDLLCVELKSLKEYILAFRNLGIFHENVVNKITEDFSKTIKPKYLKVRGDFNPRGGIKTIVTREYKAS
jgi:7-cyano-7-deazaguanine reductase